jgi:hypothetical protein
MPTPVTSSALGYHSSISRRPYRDGSIGATLVITRLIAALLLSSAWDLPAPLCWRHSLALRDLGLAMRS